MGSYITIINNTPDQWQCKVGPDEKVLKVGGIILSVFASGLFTLGALASFAPIMIASAAGASVITVTGIAPAALLSGASWTGVVTNVVGSASFFGLSTATLTNYELQRKGFKDLEPGAHHRYGKMTLSLWQQCQCVRTTIADRKTIWVDKLYMRPIFSGATANSNKNYDIKSYLQRNESVSRTIVAAVDPATGKHIQGVDSITRQQGLARNLELREDQKVFMISRNQVVDDHGNKVDPNDYM